MQLTKLIVIFLFLTAPAHLFSQSLTSTARWVAKPVSVNGIADEWQNPLNFFDVKTRLLFGIANDSTHLYLIFQNPDEKVQSKIFSCGMKLNLSVKKIKRNACISYPLPHSGDEEAGPGHTPDMMLLKNNFRIQGMMMVAEGFAQHNGMLTVSDSSIIKAAIDWNENNNMIYELAIPFTEIYGNSFTPQDLLHEIILHVELLGMKKPAGNSATQAPIGAGGVMGARGLGATNFQTGTPAGKSPWYQVQEFKQKFVLATGK